MRRISVPRSHKILTTAAVALAALTIPSPGISQASESSPANQATSEAVLNRDASPEQARANEHLAKMISERLESDRIVPSYKVKVGVQSEVATLEGVVDNLLAKERAGELARTVAGVREVRNQVEVAAPQRDDWEILAKVNYALRRNPVLERYNLATVVENGVVTLSGLVGSKHRKYLAETLVKGIPGVVQVENEIRIDLLGGRSDDEIRTDVLSRIQWDPWLNTSQLVIDVTDGKVAVAGVVESATAKERVSRDANVMGAKSVNVDGVRVVPDMIAQMEGPLQPDNLSPTGRPTGEGSRMHQAEEGTGPGQASQK